MFFDDGSFKFRKMALEDTCLVEKKNGEIEKVWAHFYAAELRFDGYKGMAPDAVIPAFGRDFILDLFNKVKEATTPSGGKPRKDAQSIKEWMKEIAETQRYKIMNKPGNMLLINKITVFLGVTLLLEVIFLGISKAWG